MARRVSRRQQKTLGERLKDLRTARDLSQVELAEVAGLSSRTIRRIEKAQNKSGGVDGATLLALSAALGVPVDHLLHGDR